MPKQPKKPTPRPVGRPKMAHGEAKGRIMALRFNPEDHKRVASAAKTAGVTVSEWVRQTLMEAAS